MVTAPVGVLALQGDFEAHAVCVRRLGIEAIPVRTAGELNAVKGLIMPGGESSAMLRLMEAEDLGTKITRRVTQGMPILATCAGVILLAHGVTPHQPSFDLLDIDVVRNAYGRQVFSSVESVRLAAELGQPAETSGVLIRAPRISRVGDGVEVLGWLGSDPVLVRQQKVLGATFHPELSRDARVHELFLALLTSDD